MGGGPGPLNSVAAGIPQRGGAIPSRCRGNASLHAVFLLLLLLLITILGCSMINRFVFTPTKGIDVTPSRNNIPYEEVWFPSLDDGVRLNGWYIAGAPGAPLVVFFHGNAGNLSENLGYITLLHGRGLPIFIFDYRGYGKSEGEPIGENDLYQDARGAIIFLQGRGWRHERMIYFGQSLGAAVALQMALESPPAGLVMESAFTSMKDIVKHLSPVGYYTAAWWGIDLHFDNLSKIGSLGVPLLLIHGNRDEVTPVEMTRRLYERAPEPKSLHIINGGGHCNVFTLDTTPYLAAWQSYLHSISVRTAASPTVKP